MSIVVILWLPVVILGGTLVSGQFPSSIVLTAADAHPGAMVTGGNFSLVGTMIRSSHAQ